ncbi:Uncharacterised protein [uncultured archaeon]|nr:Uncharacterised protein [uncultured archaeon]
MKERNLAITITLILAILGIILGVLFSSGILFSNNFTNSYYEFNFYKSDLKINGTHVEEKLYYTPDKNYHTLFRNFESLITPKGDYSVKNSVIINSVNCGAGNPYYKISGSCYTMPDFQTQNSCKPYTENNEYGCTFGDTLGFEEGNNFWISSEFTLNPDNLFKINGKYYIKFIAYGRNKHKTLTTEDNLRITGNAVYTNKYLSKEYVIIYIPYEGEINNFNIIEKPNFEYDSIPKKKQSMIIIIITSIFFILLHLIPSVLFFCSWYFFGKELTEEDVPSQLSQSPTDRKPWEVASFFNPPFGRIDSNFFSTMLFDFYRRKIIDLKLVKKFFGNNLLIKINENKATNLDNIEKEFLIILKKLKESCPKKEVSNDYFNLNKSLSSYKTKLEMSSIYQTFQKSIDEESKKYLEKKGLPFFMISSLILCFISFFTVITIFFLSFISIFIVIILSVGSSLLIKYKKDFYIEYQKWQSFKKWLKGSPAMRESKFKGVVLWEKYLVYGTALGVSKQVLKELKNEGIIDDRRYNFYSGVYVASNSFATSSGGGHGGGFGGAGGGGVGGGGGGGR